jgi:glycosyltransferase involved in cell wall biosynthesis
VFSRSRSLSGRISHRLSPHLARLVARLSSGIMILFPWQVDALGISKRVSRFHVHAFVRTKQGVVATRTDDYIVLVGKPWEAKGADILVKAFQRITEKHPTVTLVVAGSDEDPSWLQALVPPHARVEFVGRMSHDNILSLIAGAKIFALPSWTEGTPRTIIEAYSVARPVVATRTDGIPYVVRQDETGELVSLGSDEELADALDRMLSNPERTAQLGRNGQEMARTEFSAERVAKMWSDAVEQMLADKAR